MFSSISYQPSPPTGLRSDPERVTFREQVGNSWESDAIPLTYKWARVGRMKRGMCICAKNSLSFTVVSGLLGRKKT